jgi:hypothetical protein
VRCDVVYPALNQHVRGFFAGRQIEVFEYTADPVQRVLPRFRVVRVAPGPKSREWVYLSVGAWEADHDAEQGLEFLMVAPTDDGRIVELLAMTAYYHRDFHLDLAHTFPIGDGWLYDSACDHLLVSLPYPFGPDLEWCRMQGGGNIRFLWLLPITEAENQFRHEHGLEALEQRFQETKIKFADPWRQSVV